MTAFWIAVALGTVIAVAYVALALEALADARRSFRRGDPEPEPVSPGDGAEFTWKAIGAVVGSTGIIVAISLSGSLWYLAPVLALGSAAAVVAAFLIDRRGGVT